MRKILDNSGMGFAFTKMHGCGNDFVIVDQRSVDPAPDFDLDSELIRRICNRHFGVGCDQLLVLSPATRGGDASVQVFNSDGSGAEQCGNGMRCLAAFVADQHPAPPGNTGVEDLALQLEGPGQDMQALVHPNGEVTVDLGTPAFAIHQGAENDQDWQFDFADGARTWRIASVSMGNPHGVIEVQSLEHAPLATLGTALQSHWQFPQGVNLGLCQQITEDHLRLRVFERGVGETLACGSGACAAVVAQQRRGRAAQRVRVDLPGGSLVVEWRGNGSSVFLTGPAQRVFDGHWPSVST